MTVSNIIAAPKVKLIEYDSSYEYLLVISSDSLYVLSPDRSRIVETIVKGKDNDGYIAAADSEDEFLNAIMVIKRDILFGINPLRWIL